MIRKLLALPILIFVLNSASAQTFNCYIANDSIVSPNDYKFDVYIEATSADFYLRSIQLCFTFNPAFFASGATITPTIVSGSTQLHSYTTGAPTFNTTAYGLIIPSNTGSTCTGSPNTIDNNLLVVGTPVRIATYVLNSSLHFNCDQPNISMLRPSDPAISGLVKCSVSMWDSTCLAVTISGNGTYSNMVANTLYSTVNNPLDTLCVLGIDEIKNSFGIFPNPTTGIIRINDLKISNASIEVFDYAGKQLCVFKNAEHKPNINIDLSDLPTGLYFLKIGEMKKLFAKE